MTTTMTSGSAGCDDGDDKWEEDKWEDDKWQRCQDDGDDKWEEDKCQDSGDSSMDFRASVQFCSDIKQKQHRQQ